MVEGAMVLNPVSDEITAKLRAALPPPAFREASARYFEEPRGRYAGQAGLVLAPRTTDEVARVMRIASDHATPVIPYGGGTGLVGGQIAEALPAPIVLSFERMAALRAGFAEENVIIAEAGAVLADIQAKAREMGRLFPLSLASEGSARIGGVLATNAGGVNVLRYGNARDLCLGLEAVLADGRVWHGLSRLRKDNAGYDLRDLLIGSEGTLGIITAASLKLAPIPAEQGTAIFTLPSPAAALSLLALAKDQVGEGVSAFELIHKQGFAFLAETLPEVRQPFAEPPEWCALIDLGLPLGLKAPAAFEALFVAAQAAGLAQDAVIAQSEAQRGDLWRVREQIPEANRRIGSVSSHDISLPLSAIPEFIERAGPRLAQLGMFR
ncbi:MAG: FAD-binding oxidoreductase, partial [Pseudomonadota bacterium]